MREVSENSAVVVELVDGIEGRADDSDGVVRNSNPLLT